MLQEECKEKILSEEYRDFMMRDTGALGKNFPLENGCRIPLKYGFELFYIDQSEDRKKSLADYPYTMVPKCYTTLDMAAIQQAGIAAVQNIPGLELSGEGVLVGIIDTGINYLDPIFRNLDGSTRIQRIWDQEEQSGTAETTETEDLNILERTVNVLTVSDFNKLLSKENIIAIVVFSILFGIAIKMAGEKGEPLEEVLESAYTVMLKFVQLISYYSPIGLGCYFAVLVGTFGGQIALGYAKTFVIYTLVSIVYYVVAYSLYAFIAGGKNGVVAMWKNIVSPTVVALATCSSAAAIPSNTEAAKRIGVSGDIAETTVPLGTSFHKDGSIIGSVFKIMFLVCLFGTSASIWQVMIVALIANLLVTAVPIGGGTISEMMILSMMGYPVAALPILTMVATIIDAPATVLNSVGDSVASMMVARVVDGKNWMEKNK